MIQAFQLAAGRLYRQIKPWRSETYLRFIRRFPCLNCGKSRNMEACHTGPHGMSQKAPDWTCLPFCHDCHQGFDSGQQIWAMNRHQEISELVEFFNHLWFLKTGERVGVELEKAA